MSAVGRVIAGVVIDAVSFFIPGSQAYLIPLGSSLALGGAQQLFAPKVKAPPRTFTQQQLPIASPLQPLPVVYGTVRIPAAIVAAATSESNTYLTVIAALCHGPIQAVMQVLIDGTPALFVDTGTGLLRSVQEIVPGSSQLARTSKYAGYVNAQVAYGTDGQFASVPRANAPKTVTHIAKGTTDNAVASWIVTTSTAHGFSLGDPIALTSANPINLLPPLRTAVIQVKDSLTFEIPRTATDGDTLMQNFAFAGSTADFDTIDAVQAMEIIGASWDPTTHRGQGVAYLVMRFRYNADIYTALPNIEAIVQGIAGHDPRASGTPPTISAVAVGRTDRVGVPNTTLLTTAAAHFLSIGDIVDVVAPAPSSLLGPQRVDEIPASNQVLFYVPLSADRATGGTLVKRFPLSTPALCIRDYLLSSRYGPGFSSNAVDDSEFASEANYEEEQVQDPVVDTTTFQNSRAIVGITGGAVTTLQVASTTGYTTGDQVRVSGTGVLGLDGFWPVTVVDSIHFSVPVALANQPAAGFVQKVSSVNRFVANVSLDTSQAMSDNVTALLSSARAAVVFDSGLYRVFARRPTTILYPPVVNVANYEETDLALNTAMVLTSDGTASNSQAAKLSVASLTSGNALLVSGPLIPLGRGQYTATFSLKVTSKTSNAIIAHIAVTQQRGAVELASLDIRPSDFPFSNVYQSFPLTFTLGQDVVGATPTPAASDLFNRANSTTALGNDATGQTWQAIGGTWGINTNQAYQPVNSATDNNIAVVDTGNPDGLYQVTDAVTVPSGGYHRHVFRFTDANNYWYFGNSPGLGVALLRVEAGVTTTIQAFGGRHAVAGDVVQILLNGPSITCFVNGTQVATATDPFNQTATKHGLGCNVASTSTQLRWDNFSFTPFGASGLIEFRTKLVTGGLTDFWFDTVTLDRQPAVISEDNIIGDLNVTLGSDSEIANRVRCTYRNASQNYQADMVQWPEPGSVNSDLTDDNNFDLPKDVDLPATTGRYIAERIAMVTRRESRLSVTVVVTTTEEILQYRYGDVIPVDHSTPGWVNEPFWIHTMSQRPDGKVDVVLTPYDPEAYDLDAMDDTPLPALTTLPDPNVVAPPTGLAITVDAVAKQLEVTWVPSADAMVVGYEVDYRETGTNSWQSAPSAGADTNVSIPVNKNGQYDVRVIAFNALGIHSEPAEVDGTWVQLIAQPQVGPLTGESTGGGGSQGIVHIPLTFDAGTDSFLVYFETGVTSPVVMPNILSLIDGILVQRLEGSIAQSPTWATMFDVQVPANDFLRCVVYPRGKDGSLGNPFIGEVQALDSGTGPTGQPTGFNVVTVGTVNTMTWANADANAQPRIWRNGFILAVLPVGTVTLVDDTRNPGGQYHYQIDCIRNGQTTTNGGGTSQTTGTPTLAAPSWVQGYPQAGGEFLSGPGSPFVEFQFTNPDQLAQTIIQRSLSGENVWTAIATVPAGLASWVDSSGTADQFYDFRMIARRTGYNDSPTSAVGSARYAFASGSGTGLQL